MSPVPPRRPKYVFQHAHPSTKYDPVVLLLAQTTPYHRFHLGINLSLSKLFSRPPRPKSSPAPPGTHVQSPPFRGTNTRARGPPSSSAPAADGHACFRVLATPAGRTDTASAALLFALTAQATALIFYRAGRGRLFLLFLAIGAAVACAAAAVFLPKLKPSSVAQTAHCEDHLYVVNRSGQPCGLPCQAWLMLVP